MGRGRIEIRRIENWSNRQVTCSKRRKGIIKKAMEISVLCDAQISLVIVAPSGKLHEFCSPSTTLVDLMDKYINQSGNKLWDAKHEDLSREIDRIRKENDSLQIKLRNLKGEDLTSLDIKELMNLEEGLETGLAKIRDQQNEFAEMVRRNVKMAEDENRQLLSTLRKMMGKEEDEAAAASAGGQGHPEMPFVFRVQPTQPNLQERMQNNQL